MNQNCCAYLHCPVCGQPFALTNAGRTLACCGGKKVHTFDLSRSGYVNFALSGKQGDQPAATQSRSRFLEAGYYDPLADRLEELLSEYGVRSFLDAGSGEGYYTNRLAKNRTAFGVDLSKSGVDHGAKTAKQMQNGCFFAVGSIFELPVQSRSFDCVLNLFAPCGEEEFCRVLKDNGVLILVGAGERHLMGLKKVLYEHPYLNPGRGDLPSGMELLHRESLQGEITVEGQQAVSDLFSMTPYYWRTSPKDAEKLQGLSVLQTNFDFDIMVYRKNGKE